MPSFSKCRLLTTSAIIGLSIVPIATPAQAFQQFGILNDQPENLEIAVAENETIDGDDIGVYAKAGPVDITNAGTIRGNGNILGSATVLPNGGVVIAQPSSTVTNSGEISGAANGVTTAYVFSDDDNGDPLPPVVLAADTTIVNSGLIRGESGTGVALIGGGSVTNSGTIQAFTGTIGTEVRAIGVVLAEFPDATDPAATGVGTITNTVSGLIEGQLFGALLSGGGTIDNSGTIRSFGSFNPATPNVSPFGVILTANADQPGRTATVNNSGTISGLLGMLANLSLETAIINNSGLISGAQSTIFGLNSGDLIINNEASGQIIGNAAAIVSNAGTLDVTNAGLIRSNNQQGISITTADAVIDNTGTIQGGTFGITTNPFQVSPGVFLDRAINTSVTNSGSIVGLNNDGMQLRGGGTVTNSGTIRGNLNPQSDGISMFALDTQDLANYSAEITNLAGGEITGIRAGVALSSGGTLDNAGTIQGAGGGVLVQNGLGGTPVDGTINNTGLIIGSLGGSAGLRGDGIVGSGLLQNFTVTNSGDISGGASDGIFANTFSGGAIVIENAEGGNITGSASGVHTELGSLTLTNAGVIRGNGTSQGSTSPPDAGVTIADIGGSVTNSGTISGNRFGITTSSRFNPATGLLEATAVDTTIVNTGSIIGENDDGLRLIGGGSVSNSGSILALAGDFSDGISMFAFAAQSNENYSALVTNQAGGDITGNRFGIIMSGGGEVINGGDIRGAAGGIFIQGTAINTDPGEDRSGLTAKVVNTDEITGTGNFGINSTDGYGVGFGSDMSTATLDNSGTIISEQSVGVLHGSLADLTVTNAAGGVITGATSGIYGSAGGTLAVNNAGTIRGNGTYDGFDDVPDAGVTIGTADSSVTNSGTISGAGAGITTVYLFDQATSQLVFLASGTTVANSGTIAGESNDGVRLIGGGTVTNSGTISGSGSAGADGVSMFRYDIQIADDYSATVTNGANGTIGGDRFGIILTGGGTVDNAGIISGDLTGIVIRSQFDGEDAGLTGSLTNSGTISSSTGTGAQFNWGLDSVVVGNTGTINGATMGLVHATAGSLSLTNGGTIAGGSAGVVSDAGGPLNVVNTGTISSATGTALSAVTQTTLDNAGALTGGAGVAVQLSGFDDVVTLRTGSAITGVVDAGDGVDSLTLRGDVLELTNAQQVGESANFETLTVESGYWNTSGVVGEFEYVSIAETGTLQVNEVDLGADGLSSPIDTATVTTNGLLVLNFSGDDVVSELDSLTIDGTGGIKLVGNAVFTVDTGSLTYIGGTTISNGGLVLTGSLAGDVTTEGEGYFQLGIGGTEGSFAGNIVNNGTFDFNRSDDYDFGGAFSGTGTLNKSGAGILSFLGGYNFDGTTNILAGSVRIGGVIDPETDFNVGGGTLDISGNDQTIGGLEGEEQAVVVIDESELTVVQEEDTEFAGNIAGDGSIVKDGDGILNLTGDSTYTGPTTINGGTLAVNGSIVSPITVNEGGALGGNGDVGDTMVSGGGTLAPGNSIGQLTVNGDLALAAGSIYEVEVNAAGQADRVDATGAVTIANTAVVSVLAEAGTYQPLTNYIILTGAAGVTGTFGSVTTDLAFLDPRLRYGSNAVTLSLYRNDINFSAVAIGENQVGVAGAVQSLGIDNALFEAVLIQNAAGAQSAFDSLSGEILVSAISGLTDDSRHLRNAIIAMQAPEKEGAFIWGSAFGGWGQFDASAGQLAMDTDNKGIITGVGFGGNGFGVALSAGVGKSDFALSGRNDRADVDSKYLAAHATFGSQGLRGTIGVSYAWHDITTNRSVTFAPLAQTLASARDADTVQLFGELSYDFAMGNVAFTPFARLAHISTGSDAFAEAGGNAALVVTDTKQNSTFLSLGARARLNAAQQGFQPYLSAAWNRASGDRAAEAVAAFSAGGTSFALAGSLIPENSAEVEAGFDYSVGAFRIGAAYSGTLSTDRNTHGARLTASFAF